MRSSRFPAYLLGLAALLYGCQPAPEPAPEEEESAPAAMSDEEMIASLTDHFEQAWASADAKAIADQFAEDGDSIGPDGNAAHGRQEIESRYQEVLDGMYKGSSISISTRSTRMLEPGVALTDGTYEITGMKSEDGTELPPVKGLYVNVLVKHDDHWMIHNSRPMVPMEAPAPAPGT
jgi:uncharacterized protein (TIGR02246 family)